MGLKSGMKMWVAFKVAEWNGFSFSFCAVYYTNIFIFSFFATTTLFWFFLLFSSSAIALCVSLDPKCAPMLGVCVGGLWKEM